MIKTALEHGVNFFDKSVSFSFFSSRLLCPRCSGSVPLLQVHPELLLTVLICANSAEVYSNGQSEIEMGRVFKELDVDRSQIVVSTKMCVFLSLLGLYSLY